MASTNDKKDAKSSPASKKPLKDLQVRKAEAAKVKGGRIMGGPDLR